MLCGLEYHVGLSTDDSAQENLCATPGGSLYFGGWGSTRVSSWANLIREHVPIQVYA